MFPAPISKTSFAAGPARPDARSWRPRFGDTPDSRSSADLQAAPQDSISLSDVVPLPVTSSAAGSSPVVATSAGLTQVLYLQESGDSAAISVTDVHPGQMGDCYLCTSIGELALFHPSWITNMIQSNADGSETVTLYRASNGSLPTFGTTAFTAVSINVVNSFPSNSVNSGASQDVYNGQKEIWVQVLEKAVATLYGGYNGIANGGCPAITMEELTGCTGTSVSSRSLSLQQLQTASAAGNLIAFDTLASANLPYHTYGSHAYMFQSLSTVNGTVMVNLLNPWGFSNPDPIPFSQIASAFADIEIDQFADHQTINVGPVLVRQTTDQTWTQASRVSLTLPAGTFFEASGQQLTYAATQASGQALPSWLIFNSSTQTFSGTVPSGMQTLSLSVTATDTSGLSCSETFKVTVPAAAPTLTHQTAAQTWTEGTQLSFALASNTFTDPNGQALSYVATVSNGSLPSWLTLDSTSGTFSGTVPYSSGPLSIKVTATDTSGLSASETFKATLVAPAPTMTDQTEGQSWTAGQALSFALASDTFTAVPGQILRYSATLPTGLTIDASSGRIRGTVPFAPGVYTIKVTAIQTNGLSASETFKATVVAAAPTLADQTPGQNWTANRTVSLSVASAFADPQGEKLTYSASLSNGKALPTGLTFNATTATFGGLAPTALGDLGIKVTAKDQSGLSASETFQVTMVASAPTLANQTPSQTWTANKAISFTLPSNVFVDPQGEKFTYAATLADGSALPNWLKLNPATGGFTGTASVTPQTLAVTVTATDQSGLSASQTFQATIQAAAPTVGKPTSSLTWTAGKPVSAVLASNTFVDPQGEKLTYSATQSDGSALPDGLRFNTASDAFSGTAPITPETLGLTVTATNASGLSVSENVSVTIQAGAPTLSHQTANQVWTAGSSMSFLLPKGTFADPQGGTLSYAAYETSGADQTGWLRFDAASADFLGTVPTALTGTIGIKIVATNAYGLANSETFALTFAPKGAHLAASGAPGATEMLMFHS